MGQPGYLFSNENPEAGSRFDSLAALFDPWSLDHLARLGVAEGWRCLEIGAGGGSVAAWLSDRVGGTGSVLATDLDVRWLDERLRAPNVQVRQHDIVSDALPDRAFDVIHERLVLVHIPEREQVLHRLVTALTPGGWVLSETFDVGLVTNAWLEPGSEPGDVGERLARGIQTLLRARGADATLGHKLPGLMRDAGLVDVGADAYQVLDGGDGPRRLFRANILQSAEQLIDQDLIGRDELERFVARLDAGDLNLSTPLLVAAWGRRPEDPS